MVQRNWLLGKRIADEELQGEDRAEYGKGFAKSNLYQLVQFYKFFPEIFHSLRG